MKFPAQVPEDIVAACGGNHAFAKRKYEQWKIKVQERRAEGIRRQRILSIANFKALHTPINGLGQSWFRIDELLRKSIADEYGWDLASNDQFCKELIRDNDWFCFKPTTLKKASIIRPNLEQVAAITLNPAAAA
jgi:hypothetical protein